MSTFPDHLHYSKNHYFQQQAPGNMDEPTVINVPLLVGLLSGIGTLLLGLLCAVIWFAIVGQGRIRLGEGDPGEYDDEQQFLEQETEALEHMDEASRQNYLSAKAFIETNPPNSASDTDISLSQYMTIQEKGVSAWEFENGYENWNGCFVEDRTEIEFFDALTSVQTNLPLPKQNDVYYWEAKIYDKPVNTTLSIGLSTKPYPLFRLPGYHKFSVAYDSTGCKRHNQPFKAPHYGPPLQPGDVVGCGYRTRSGTIFFTRNGKKLEDVVHGYRMNLFPTIGSNGPSTVVVNFGHAGFVFIEANVKKWGLAPVTGSLAPPPPYGAEIEDVLLESSGQNTPAPVDAHDSSLPPPPAIEEDEGETSTSHRSVGDITEIDDHDNDEGVDTINLSRLDRRRQRQEASPPARPSNEPHPPRVTSPSPPPSYTSNDSDDDDNNDDDNRHNNNNNNNDENDRLLP